MQMQCEVMKCLLTIHIGLEEILDFSIRIIFGLLSALMETAQCQNTWSSLLLTVLSFALHYEVSLLL